LQHIEARYRDLKRGHSAKLWSAYLSKVYWKDETHVFQAAGKFFNGRIEFVEKDGKLRIATDQGPRLFDLKEVVFVK
jgi:BirA family biotin operon repressor/biotin-[acetyl-CoA-carboxylase] ligase